MKKLFMTSLMCLFFIALSFSQKTEATIDLAAQGSNNGCLDGTRTAYNENYFNTLNSIMDNPSISAEYKDAYYNAFYSCRRTTLNGEVRDSGLSDVIKCKFFNNISACSNLAKKVGQ